MNIYRFIILFTLIWAACPLFAQKTKTPLPQEDVQSAINKFIADPSLRNASVGISMITLDSMNIIGEYNTLQSQITASTMKTVTSATALSLLGHDFRFHTKVFAKGKIQDGNIDGDLVIKGGGDPTLDSEHLPQPSTFIDSLVAILKSNGIKEITGNITIDESVYPTPYTPASWMIEDLGYGYGTSIHALNYADNTLKLNYDLQKDTFIYNTIQSQNYLQVRNHCNVIEEENDSISLTGMELRLDIDTDILHLYGNVKPENKTITIANPSPDLLLRDSIEIALKNAGIKIGNRQIEYDKPQNNELLLDYQSSELSEIVNSLLVRSDNMYTECVLRAIAINSGKQATTENGVEIVKKYWAERGVDVTGLFMIDGSGLARTNKAPASFFTHMLSIAYNDFNQNGITFQNLFPIAGKNGTVKRVAEKTTAAGKFALKSGSMSHVQCYVGYYPIQAPKYCIAILINSFTGKRSDLVKNVSKMLVDIDNALSKQ